MSFKKIFFDYRNAKQPWGIAVGITQVAGSNQLEIRRIAANTPAFYSDLRIGDFILTVNGLSSINWSIAQAEKYFTTINVADITYSRKPEVVDLVNDDEDDDDDFDDEEDDEEEDDDDDDDDGDLHYSSRFNYQRGLQTYSLIRFKSNIINFPCTGGNRHSSTEVIDLISDSDEESTPLSSSNVNQSLSNPPVPRMPSVSSSVVQVPFSSPAAVKRPLPPDSSTPSETKRSKTDKSVKIKLEFEPKKFGEANFGDEVVEVAPMETAVEVVQALASCTGSNGDDVEFVGGNVIVASEMPHARESCTQFPFCTVPTSSNERRCHFCYCYVCDIIASECLEWTKHCNASYRVEIWRRERKMRSSGSFIHLNGAAKSVFMRKHSYLIELVSAEQNELSYGGGYNGAVFSDDEYGVPVQSSSAAQLNYLQYDGEYLEKLVDDQRHSATKAVGKLLTVGVDLMRELRAISTADSSAQFENSMEFKFAEACTVLLMLLNTVVGKRCKRLWDSSCAAFMVSVLLNPKCTREQRASFSAICTDASFARMGKRCMKLRAVSALLRASDKEFESIYRDDVTDTVSLSAVAALLPQSLFQEMAARKYKRTVAKLIEHEPIGLLVYVASFLLESNDEESVDLCRSMLQRVIKDSGNFSFDNLQVEVTRCLLHIERKGVVLLMAMILDLQMASTAAVEISKCKNILFIIGSKWVHITPMGSSPYEKVCDSFAAQSSEAVMLSRARRCLSDGSASSMFGVVAGILVFSSQLCLSSEELLSHSANDIDTLVQLDQIFNSLKSKSFMVALASGITTYQPPFTVDKQLMLHMGRLLIVREYMDSNSSFDCLKSVSGVLKSEMSKVPVLFGAASTTKDNQLATSSMKNGTTTVTREQGIEHRLVEYLFEVAETLTGDSSSQRLNQLLNEYELCCNMLWRESLITLHEKSATRNSSSLVLTPPNEKAITSDSTTLTSYSVFRSIWKCQTTIFLQTWFEQIKSYKMVSDHFSMMKINFYCLACAGAVLYMAQESKEDVLFIIRSFKWIFFSEDVVANWEIFARYYGFGPSSELGSSSEVLNYSIFNTFWCPVLSSSSIFTEDAIIFNVGALILLGCWDRLRSSLRDLSEQQTLLVINQLLLLTADEFYAIENSDTIGKSAVDGILAEILGGGNNNVLANVSKCCCSSPNSFLSVAIYRTDPNLIIPAAEKLFPFFLAVLRERACSDAALKEVYDQATAEVSKWAASIIKITEDYDVKILLRLVLCCCVVNLFDVVSTIVQKYRTVLTVESIFEMLCICGDVGLFVKEFEHLLAELYLDPSVPAKLQFAVDRVCKATSNCAPASSKAYVKLLLFYHYYDMNSFQGLSACIDESYSPEHTRLVKNWMQKVQDSSRVITTTHLDILFKLLSEFEMRNYLSHLSLFSNDMRFNKDDTVAVLLRKSVDLPQSRLSLFLCIAHILLTMESLTAAIRKKLRDTLTADMVSYLQEKVSKDSAEMYSLIHIVMYLNDPLSERKYLETLKQTKPEMFHSKKKKILSLVINDADLSTTIQALTQERALPTLLDHLKSSSVLFNRRKDDNIAALAAILRHLADNMTLPLFLPDAANLDSRAELENQLFQASSTVNKFIDFVLLVQEQIKLVEMVTAVDKSIQSNPQVLATANANNVAVIEALNRLVTAVGTVTQSEVVLLVLKLCIAFIPPNIFALYNLCTSLGYYSKDGVGESFADYHSKDNEVKYGLSRRAKILDWVIFRVVSAESCLQYDIDKIQTLLVVSKANSSCGLVALFSVHQNLCGLIRYIVEEKSTKFYNGRDSKVEVSKKGMLYVSFKKAKNTQIEELLCRLISSNGKAAVAVLVPLLVNRMNDCNINCMTNFTTSSFQTTYTNSIMLRKEFKRVMDMAILTASPEFDYLDAMIQLKDQKSSPIPWSSAAVQAAFSQMFQSPSANQAACIAIIAAIVMHIILSGKQTITTMISLLFFKFENHAGTGGRQCLFKEAIITAVVEHFIAHQRASLQVELVLRLTACISRGVDIEDVIKQPLLLKEVTIARTGQDILQRGSLNFESWDYILRHATNPDVQREFCGYLVDCIITISNYAVSHTVRNATKTSFHDTVVVLSKFVTYIRRFESLKLRLQKVVAEAKKMLKSKKAVADILRIFDQC